MSKILEPLPPCPFCRGAELYEVSNGMENYFVECEGCGTSGPVGVDGAKARALWENRLPQTSAASVPTVPVVASSAPVDRALETAAQACEAKKDVEREARLSAEARSRSGKDGELETLRAWLDVSLWNSAMDQCAKIIRSGQAQLPAPQEQPDVDAAGAAGLSFVSVRAAEMTPTQLQAVWEKITDGLVFTDNEMAFAHAVHQHACSLTFPSDELTFSSVVSQDATGKAQVQFAQGPSKQ